MQSMTGYGKADSTIGSGKITIEVRSLNGKSIDVSLKGNLIPREREIEIKQLVAARLVRGTIDLYAIYQPNEEGVARRVNPQAFHSYLEQLTSLTSSLEPTFSQELLVDVALRLPDIFESGAKKEQLDEEIAQNWEVVEETIERALKELLSFRESEGEKLREEIVAALHKIFELLEQVEPFEVGREERVRERLLAKVEESIARPDLNRFEQEIIYYIEKYDIKEEKVRLKQHCNYFLETLESESHPGKKLVFISQEMGREINTLGSKANEANIQKLVVEMKEQLEKIKEQLLNIL